VIKKILKKTKKGEMEGKRKEKEEKERNKEIENDNRGTKSPGLTGQNEDIR
jgi:hypothetical protein